MPITIPVHVTQESNLWLQLLSAVVNGTHKAINNPVFLALVDGVTDLTHKFILLVETYRFYDFPSVNQTIGRTVIK